jgi:hypothetical protein
MSVPAKVGEAVPLVMILEDGNENQYPQAEIYEAGATVPLATIDLDHKVKGRYEGTWTATSVGAFSAQFFVYSDAGHTIENIVYVRAVEQVFVTDSDVDDLAAGIIRLLGLHRENVFIDNTDFDIFNQLISCRIRLYDSKDNAEAAQDGDNYSTGLIATYTMEAEHEAAGKMKSFRQVKV